MVAAALRGALSDRARDGRVHVVDSFLSGEKPSTKEALKALEAVTGRRVLVVLTRDEEIAWLSLRNVATLHVLAVDQLNAYDVVVSDDVVFSAKALDAYVAGPARGKSAKAVGTASSAATQSERSEEAERSDEEEK
jgi:large subunit ribosomal protein L4